MASASRTQRVRVLVADDHPIFREGIVKAVKDRPDLELVGEAGDGRVALEQIRELKPDVAVLDIRMPGLEGTQVLSALKRDGAPTEVLFLSAFMEAELAYTTVAEGARGYLSKEAPRQEICDAIVAVSRGDTALAPEVQAALAQEIRDRERTQGRRQLSPRESQVLKLIAEGHSAPEIARQIHLSPTTVKTHLGTLYEKLGVSDRAAAVAEGMRRGLLE
jgi:two-component system, NarL family, nitrate/nitrite response regulator NarL